MKKILSIMVIAFVTMIVVACNGNIEKSVDREVLEALEVPEEEQSVEENDSDIERQTIQFETGEVSIVLSDGWTVEPTGGTAIPFTERTYNLWILSPQGEEEAGMITVGRIVGGHALSDEEFYTWHTTRVANFLPRAVEEEADFFRKEVYDGQAVYATLTDADLIGTIPPPEEWIYMSKYFANYSGGFLVYASLFTNELNSENHRMMLEAVASIKIYLEAIESMSVNEWRALRREPVYDLVDFNLLYHNLEDSEFLTEYILESSQTGEQFVVSVIGHGEPFHEDIGHVIWNSGGIGMLYYLVPSQDVLDILDAEVSNDLYRLGRDGLLVSTNGYLRMSEDEQMAAFGFEVEIGGGPNVVYIYLLQSIPDSEYTLFLLFILFYNYWSEEDPEILSELSEHMGIELISYWPW